MVSSRRELRAILVVLVTIAALFVASARSPDAVFATLLARASVADTHEATLRTTPSNSDGSDGVAPGLRAAIETPKIVSSASSTAFAVTSALTRDRLVGRAPEASASALAEDWASSIDHPPTRARARLMVFLN